jgi:maleate cis-trans isomerase
MLQCLAEVASRVDPSAAVRYLPDDAPPIDVLVDQLMEREVDLIMQSGVPLPLLLGVEGHDRLIDRISKHSGKPATSSVLGVVAAAKRLGLRRIAVASKWSEPMIGTLGEFFARGGTEIVGFASEVLSPAQFQKIPIDDHMMLAYELGRSALTRYPDADGLYIGGGSWLSEPVCQALEREFGKPAISNPSAAVWDTLTRLGGDDRFYAESAVCLAGRTDGPGAPVHGSDVAAHLLGRHVRGSAHQRAGDQWRTRPHLLFNRSEPDLGPAGMAHRPAVYR